MKPRRNPRKKPATPGRTKLVRAAAALPAPMRPDHTTALRELFWQNVMREMLTSLSVLSIQRSDAEQAAAAAAPPPAESPADGSAEEGVIQLPGNLKFDPSLFDGRLAIVTKAGERIPIAAVFPLFACGINTPNARALSAAVECTVFQISTPDGHVFTIPLHEIRCFHAMSEEIMTRLEKVARRRAERREANEVSPPFGFAAFTSMVRGEPPPPMEPPPAHPTE